MPTPPKYDKFPRDFIVGSTDVAGYSLPFGADLIVENPSVIRAGIYFGTALGETDDPMKKYRWSHLAWEDVEELTLFLLNALAERNENGEKPSAT